MVVRTSAIALVAGVLGACGSFDAAATPDDGGAGAGDASSDGGSADAADAGPTTASESYAAAVIADQPLGFWRLGEKSGAATLQSVQGGHALVPTNGPTLGLDGLFPPPSGAVGFDGVQGRRLVASTLPNLMENGRAFAIEMWLFLGGPSDSSYRHLAAQSDGTRELSVWVRAGKIGFDLYDLGVLSAVDRPEPASLQWHHVVAQAASMREPRLWVDGAEVALESPAVATAVPQKALTLGAENDGAPSLPVGSKVAEIAVYDHVLVPERVLAHFTLGKEQ
jgi:hypothetical protein